MKTDKNTVDSGLPEKTKKLRSISDKGLIAGLIGVFAVPELSFLRNRCALQSTGYPFH